MAHTALEKAATSRTWSPRTRLMTAAGALQATGGRSALCSMWLAVGLVIATVSEGV